jgi:hypothetical protein
VNPSSRFTKKKGSHTAFRYVVLNLDGVYNGGDNGEDQKVVGT